MVVEVVVGGVVEVVVGEVVAVVDPVVVEPVLVDPVVVGEVIAEAAVDSVEAVELVPLLLFATTTTAMIRPTMIAINPAISRCKFPRGRAPFGPRPSGPIILVGSSCT